MKLRFTPLLFLPFLLAACSGGNSTGPVSTTESSTSVSSAVTEASTAYNATYEHIHLLFRSPVDGSLLMGAHTGLFKSTDNGKTFLHTALKSSDTSISPNTEFMNVSYDAQNKILYAGTHGAGVLKSTDMGLTWSKAGTGIEGNDIHGLAINPLDPKRVYAYSVDHGLYGSNDGAKTWNKIDDGPKNPNVKAFAYMPAFTSMDQSMGKQGSTNIGYLWAATGDGLYSSFACFCGWTPLQTIPSGTTVYAIAQDPQNKSAMLLAKKDGFYRTTDESKSFTLVSADLNDVGALWFDLTNPKAVFVATNAGIIYTSHDSGVTWAKVQ